MHLVEDSMTICISRDGQQIGEWTEEEVRAFYEDGKFLATDQYWKEGMTEWASLEKLLRPIDILPEGLRPVNKRRNVTASQIFPRLDAQPSGTQEGKTTSREDPLKFDSFKSVSSSKPLSFDTPEVEAEPPSKAGWTGTLRNLFSGKSSTNIRTKALNLYVMQLSLRGAILLDSHTRLDGLKLASDGTINFHYTLFTPAKPSAEEITKTWTSKLRQEYRTSVRDKTLRDYDVTTKHEFVYKDGAVIARIIIRPEDAKSTD
jgi:hypothetical protein